jgi:formate dehydrogenase subunit gamma
MKPGTVAAGLVPRHSPAERVAHWIVAFAFLHLMLSGLSFFHPWFWFFSTALGGGAWARIMHPFTGLVMFVTFFWLAAHNWSDNKIRPYDLEWKKRLRDIIDNRDENLPEIDKYNYGQKQLFWAMVVLLILLLASGFVLWRPYFAPLFPIPLIRFAAVVHSVCAFALILGVIVHVYSGVFWVRGALRGMTRGTVTARWALHHHPLWYRRMSGNR